MDRMRCAALLFASLLIISLSVVNANADNHEHQLENEPFIYNIGSKNGPENWGNLKSEWKTCAKGKLQSPIDLGDDRVAIVHKLGALKKAYKPAPAIIKNRGHDVQVAWKGDAGYATINGTQYNLLQCHWHTPSEHTVKGKKYDMEIHMVHKTPLGQIAVVSVLYKLGRRDAFLAKLIETIKKTEPEHEENITGDVDPREIKFGGKKYYRYLGSLTVPPCTEGVLWSVHKKVRTVSSDQIQALKKAVHNGFEKNARPTQKSDADVYMYDPSGTQG